ncbi:uncharacterized protein LOC133178594 [Saccostrea echinata]|uniref:uncharacterized protein LOC133178594 n=1 Tax=Saccostrea echinata TaxID=191078 RepID=UPI002A83BCE8|nr:uncharacterized protein LOC133178594 [Saccostrea echinata]
MAVAKSLVTKRISEKLAPSKALQDAKEKLGPVYFDAKLVECPQNAVELAKLLNNLDELDKQRMKILDEAKKNQRILLQTLQSRYTFSKSSPTLSANQSIRDIKLPPPGFRYHANGDPKLSLLESRGESPYPQETSFQNITEHDDVLLKQTFIASDSNLHQLQKARNADEESTDLEEEIKEVENLIREIEKDLKRSKISVHDIGSAREKAMSFLRAHSHGADALAKSISEPLSFSKPNDRFPFQPGTSTFASKKSSPTLKERPKSTSHSSCIACQYKLKHSSEDFKRLTDNINGLKFKKWNIAPSGTLVKSPSLKIPVKSSILQSSSSSKSKISPTNRVTFNLDKGTKSEALMKTRPKSSIDSKVPTEQACGTRLTQSALSYRGRSGSALFDHRSVIEAWKEITEEETQHCNEKVKRFLESLQKHPS